MGKSFLSKAELPQKARKRLVGKIRVWSRNHRIFKIIVSKASKVNSLAFFIGCTIGQGIKSGGGGFFSFRPSNRVICISAVLLGDCSTHVIVLVG